ncbi:MAG: heat-inducible transcriptional repressor HrcA [Oscillospiraceae bacterium]|jgi:heat-inducible transcriptional repressor|nr:heat-inducible transcriptional repressor HrcA [Oscillospiraceae bacterium]
MKIPDRKKEILRAIIDRYVGSAEPVGSKSLSAELQLSPATIRGEMSELESQGLLEQPHTSAGRIPTARAYRVYVDELMRRHELSLEETAQLNRALRGRIEELDSLIAYAGRVVSQLTNLPAYAAAAPRAATISRFELISVDARGFIAVAMRSNDEVVSKLVRLPNPIPDGLLLKASAVLNASFTNITDERVTELLLNSTARAIGDTVGLTAILAQFVIETLTEPPTELTVSGSARIFDYPEYRDADKARRLLEYLAGDSSPPTLPAPDDGADVKITIGPENLAEELRDSGVVVTRCAMGDGTDLLVGVVGPTRMNYAGIVTKLKYLTSGLATINSEQLTINNFGTGDDST